MGTQITLRDWRRLLDVSILSMSISVPELIGSGPGARDVVPATLPTKSLINKTRALECESDGEG